MQGKLLRDQIKKKNKRKAFFDKTAGFNRDGKSDRARTTSRAMSEYSSGLLDAPSSSSSGGQSSKRKRKKR
jgi:hypothetical protein